MVLAHPQLKVGDPVLRICGNCEPARLRISALTPAYVIAGPWRFDRITLVEITDFGEVGGSYLTFNTALAHLDQMTAEAQDFPGGYS
jgi:hypothetical protein